MGRMTRAGTTQRLGTILMSDIKLETLQKTKLDLEHVKHLFDVKATTGIPAWYRQILIPDKIPRLLGHQ